MVPAFTARLLCTHLVSHVILVVGIHDEVLLSTILAALKYFKGYYCTMIIYLLTVHQ